jgi:hypothetical protein
MIKLRGKSEQINKDDKAGEGEIKNISNIVISLKGNSYPLKYCYLEHHDNEALSPTRWLYQSQV